MSKKRFSLLRVSNGRGVDFLTLREDFGSVTEITDDVDKIVELVSKRAQPHDHIVIMSNGAFDGIYQKLIERLKRI